MNALRRATVTLLLVALFFPACGDPEPGAPANPGSRSKSPAEGSTADPVVAAVRRYLNERLRDEAFADGLGVESFDHVGVSAQPAADSPSLVRAIRRRAKDDPALVGVDIASTRIATVIPRAGGGPWLLVVVDAETGQPLTVVRMDSMIVPGG